MGGFRGDIRSNDEGTLVGTKATLGLMAISGDSAVLISLVCLFFWEEQIHTAWWIEEIALKRLLYYYSALRSFVFLLCAIGSYWLV